MFLHEKIQNQTKQKNFAFAAVWRCAFVHWPTIHVPTVCRLSILLKKYPNNPLKNLSSCGCLYEFSFDKCFILCHYCCLKKVVFAEHPVFHNASGCSLSSEVLLQQSMLGGGLWVMRWARHS